MPNPTWPSNLPAPAASAADYSPLFDNILKSQMEVGQKRRRLSTYCPDVFKSSVILDAAQVATLKAFYGVTLQSILPFDWTDWRTGEPCTYAFQSAPTYSLFPGTTDVWTASLELVTVP